MGLPRLWEVTSLKQTLPFSLLSLDSNPQQGNTWLSGVFVLHFKPWEVTAMQGVCITFQIIFVYVSIVIPYHSLSYCLDFILFYREGEIFHIFFHPFYDRRLLLGEWVHLQERQFRNISACLVSRKPFRKDRISSTGSKLQSSFPVEPISEQTLPTGNHTGSH